MKKQLGLLFLITFSIPAFSQTSALLTKEETINYINKKVQEAKGHSEKPWGHYPTIVSDCGFRKVYNGENIEYKLRQEWYSYEVEFNPSHIKTVKENTQNGNEVVGNIMIYLIGNTAKTRQSTLNDGDVRTTDALGILYLKSDPANYNRIYKALMHLRDLYKAEGDPFDN